MKRKLSKKFQLCLQRTAIFATILLSVAIAKWTGDATATVFLVLIGVPILFCNEVIL